MNAPLVAEPAAVILATVAALLVTIEYPLLTPIRRSATAMALMFMLIATDGVLLLTISRVIFGEFPGRYETLTALFWFWGIGMLIFGWFIWYQQTTGARARRHQRLAEKKPRPTDHTAADESRLDE